MGKFNEKLKENYCLVPLVAFSIFAIAMVIIVLIATMN